MVQTTRIFDIFSWFTLYNEYCHIITLLLLKQFIANSYLTTPSIIDNLLMPFIEYHHTTTTQFTFFLLAPFIQFCHQITTSITDFLFTPFIDYFQFTTLSITGKILKQFIKYYLVNIGYLLTLFVEHISQNYFITCYLFTTYTE